MLTEPNFTAFLATTNPNEAKEFYSNVLGLTLVSEDPYALEYKGLGASLRITTVEEFIPQAFTVFGFKINDIESQVKSLLAKGITFERYSSLEQNEFAIWQSPSTAKVAWFKDPDGNLISLTEFKEIEI